MSNYVDDVHGESLVTSDIISASVWLNGSTVSVPIIFHLHSNVRYEKMVVLKVTCKTKNI